MNEEFACAILFEHVRAFQMQKSSQSMDCFSLAIQVWNIIIYEPSIVNVCVILKMHMILGNFKSI